MSLNLWLCPNGCALTSFLAVLSDCFVLLLVSRVSCVILGAVLFNYFVAVFLLLCGPCQLLCQFGLTLSCVCDVKRLPKQFETLKLQTKECHLFFGIKLAAVHVQFLLFDHCLFFMFSRARLKSGGWVGPFVVL